MNFSKKQLLWAAVGAAALLYMWKEAQAADVTKAQSAAQAPVVNNLNAATYDMGGTDFGTTTGDW